MRLRSIDNSVNRSGCAVALGFLLLAPRGAWADDWPQYAHDAGRTGYTAEAVPLTPHLQWTFTPPAPPAPAWPEPVREYNLMSFDYAFQAVVADGLVFFGSSADCRVYALDAETGKVAWTYSTDGPIRFAPAVWQDRVFAGSDDGCVYCLSTKDGKLLWKHRIGPSADMIIGNGRMISRWPLRSGLAVIDGLVYCSAGIWPTEKTFMCALKAEDGTEAWKTEPPEFGPQGYLSLNSRFIYVPAGRAPMWVMARDGGGAHPIHPLGRSAPMAREDVVITGPQTHGANENLPVAGSPPLGPRAASVWAWTPGMERVIKPAANGKTAYAFGTDAVYLAGSGKLAAYSFGFDCKWEVEAPPQAFAVITANRTIVIGGDNLVALHSADDGKRLAEIPVEGQARGLAAAGGDLFVSLDDGRILCYRGEVNDAPAVHAPSERDTMAMVDSVKTAEAILKDSELVKGFCLVAGDIGLAAALTQRTDLHVIALETDEAKVFAARNSLADTGLYGTRITVFRQTGDKLPLPDYFANLVVVSDPAGTAPEELHRVLRPSGGIAYCIGSGNENWIRGEGIKVSKLSKDIRKCVRSPLPGATDWTHQYANAGKSASSGDTEVKWPLSLLWFGEPGPARIMNRHLRGSAPVTSGGRLFVLGQHDVMAFDVYNGTELWSWRMPSIQRRVVDILGGSMASDTDSVYVCTAGQCLRIGADDGKSSMVYRVPVSTTSLSLAEPQDVEIGGKNSIAMKATGSGIELTLATKDTKVVNADPENNPVHGDSWELFFDFRPESRRSAFYEQGVCHVIVVPATQETPSASWKTGPWSGPIEIEVEGEPATDGSLTLVRISWDNISKASGHKPSVFGFGAILNSSSDGAKRMARHYKFATRSSHRIADFLCAVTVKGGESMTTGSPLDALGAPEDMAWGNLLVLDDVIVGTVVEQADTPDTLRFGWDLSSEGKDFTGPAVADVLNSVGAASATRCVFAMDKDNGKMRWTYMAKRVIPHTGLCVLDDRVYLIDRPPQTFTAWEKKGDTEDEGNATLVVLDLATGRKIREMSEGMTDYGGLRGGHDVLLASSMRGMTAYDVKEMKSLWSVNTHIPMEAVHHCTPFLRMPVITEQWVYDDPFAYELRTGKQRLNASGDGQPWIWGNYRGCGTVSGSESLLFFRSSNPAVVDATGTPEHHKLGGFRPGCYINMIPACGLALMPEASSGCGCPYNFQATVVLAPE